MTCNAGGGSGVYVLVGHPEEPQQHNSQLHSRASVRATAAASSQLSKLVQQEFLWRPRPRPLANTELIGAGAWVRATKRASRQPLTCHTVFCPLSPPPVRRFRARIPCTLVILSAHLLLSNAQL